MIILLNGGIAGVFRLELALAWHRTSHPAPVPSSEVQVSRFKSLDSLNLRLRTKRTLDKDVYKVTGLFVLLKWLFYFTRNIPWDLKSPLIKSLPSLVLGSFSFNQCFILLGFIWVTLSSYSVVENLLS